MGRRGLIALCGALSYGALVRRMCDSGGEYLFLSRALHPAAGFVAGWVSLLAGFTAAIAFAASAFEAYLLPAAWRPPMWPDGLGAVLVIGLAALAHGLTGRLGTWLQNTLVAVKLALLLGILFWAVWQVPAAAWRGGPLRGADGSVPVLGLVAFAQAVVWISLSYAGFNAAVYVAGEVVDARRQVPRALVVGTVLVIALYLALNALFLYAPSPTAIAGVEDIAARAVAALGGAPLAGLVRGVIALALLTSVSSMIVAGPRVYARMAADGVLPRALAASARGPGRAIALQAVLAAVVVVSTRLETLLSYLGFTLSLSSALCVSSLFVLRRREGARSVPVPGYPWVPGFYVVATLGCAMVAAWARPLEPLTGLATLAVGLLLWRWTTR